MNEALVVIDFINEIVDEKGKLAGKGYTSFVSENNTFAHLNELIKLFKEAGKPVIFVRLAFDPEYTNQPKQSPLFGKAHEFGVLDNGSWGTEIHKDVDYQDDDTVIIKSRVSAFHDTGLKETLVRAGVQHVYLAGVATDLAVEAAARSAHDNDFIVSVVANACAAANMSDHQKSLSFLPKISNVVDVKEVSLGSNH